MQNCEFRNCACTNKNSNAQAGAVFHNIVDNKTLDFKEFDSETNKAFYEGGYSLGTRTTIEHCKFYDCYSAGGSGGAVESDALDITISDCSFENSYTNKNGGSGGAINVYAQDMAETTTDCSLAVIDCTFNNSRAMQNGNGGAIRTTSLRLTLTRCEFEDARATKGGAVNMTNKYAKNLEIYGCKFNTCSADENGGGVRTLAKTVIIGDSEKNNQTIHTTFKDCTAQKNGGGLYHNNSNDSVRLENVSFETCEARGTDGADLGGGAIYTNTKDLSITGANSKFKDCTAQKYGGGVCHNNNVNGSAFTFEYGTFESCTAIGDYGGAIYSPAKTVTLTKATVKDSKANAQGGGVWMNPTTTASVSNCTISGNSVSSINSKGGGVYLGGGTTTFSSIVSGCSAAFGGGVYLNSGTLNIRGGSISGSAFDNGGGVYQNNGTINHNAGTLGGTATNNGGAVYKNNGSYTVGDYTIGETTYTGAKIGTTAKVEGTTTYTAQAVNGGAVYQQAGTFNLNAGAAISGKASDSGGGFHIFGGVLEITGGVITDCEATGKGGGVYFASSSNTLNFYGDSNAKIQNCRAANGGGVWLNSSTFHMGASGKSSLGTIENCEATENGGGIYVASGTLNHRNASVITGCKASGNGGGVYQAGGTVNMENTASVSGGSADSNAVNGGGIYVADGTWYFKGGSVTGNRASGNGGGICYAGGTLSTSGNVADKSVTNNTAGKGGGIFVADTLTLKIDSYGEKFTTITGNHARTEGGGIAVGGVKAIVRFINNVQVQNNTMGANNIPCNVYLNYDQNTIIQNEYLNSSSYIGVYASDDQDADHGQPGKLFATYTGNNNGRLNVYHNDRRHYLYGVNAGNNLVAWADFVCKITDGDGNLLYKDDKGTPAVYEVLENRANSDKVPNGAFTQLNKADPGLWKKAENGQFVRYTDEDNKGYQVQMLVRDYEMGITRQIKLTEKVSRKVTLTTASVTEDECGFKYTGDERFSATIKRTAATWAMINASGGSWELTLRKITLDGNHLQSTDAGSILHLEVSNSAILDDGATLQNGAINPSMVGGGAVYLKDAATSFTMKTGSIIKPELFTAAQSCTKI